MKVERDWKNQNHPQPYTARNGFIYYPLPVLARILDYKEDTVDDLLPGPETFGWDDSLPNAMAWACNHDRVVAFTLDVDRYGCLPHWFPTTDAKGQTLAPQTQVDRFLFLLDWFMGGLPDDHTQIPMRTLIDSLIELWEHREGYAEIEEGIDWPSESES